MSSNKSVLITGGTVVNASGEVLADVMIDQGVVQEVGPNIAAKYAAESEGGPQRIDATSCVITSAFVDLHTHLREPGREESETIETGSRAAVLGGYGAVVAMPNTEPAQDSVAVVEFVRMQGERAGLVDVVPSACITVNRAGLQLGPFLDSKWSDFVHRRWQWGPRPGHHAPRYGVRQGTQHHPHATLRSLATHRRCSNA